MRKFLVLSLLLLPLTANAGLVRFTTKKAVAGTKVVAKTTAKETKTFGSDVAKGVAKAARVTFSILY